MNPGLMTIIIFGSLFILLMLGLPLVFALGSISVVGLLLILGPKAIQIIYWNTIDKPKNLFYITIPLFIYMAYMMERSGVVEDMYRTIQYWSGRIAGSLAIGTVLISTILAAMVGISSAAIVTMGVTVLPSMIKRGYDPKISIGSITAGSTLGILIPPSALGLLYATYAGVSVGRMFSAGLVPGILLAVMFIVYIGIKCSRNPSLGPPVQPSEIPSEDKSLRAVWSLLPPAFLVLAVLGSIFMGIASPTEAAAVGALGATILVAAKGKLNWNNFKQVNYKTLQLTGMIMWVLIAASSFRALYVVTGAIHFIEDALIAVPFGTWGTIIVMQLILLIMGAFLDEFGILIIAMSAFLPVVQALGIDPLWFGILFIINMEIAELTPPVGLNLFYMKAVLSKGTPTTLIYKSVTPFILILLVGLILIMVFPQLATWLPSVMIK